MEGEEKQAEETERDWNLDGESNFEGARRGGRMMMIRVWKCKDPRVASRATGDRENAIAERNVVGREHSRSGVLTVETRGRAGMRRSILWITATVID